MRAARIVQLLLLLQTRGRLTAVQLAEELEVSVRTVYRDVEALHAAGVPLYGQAGHAGGYRLVDGYRTRLTGLTENEAESLFLTGLPGPAHELGLGAEVAAAWLKLTASLPPELRDRATRIQQRFHLDAPSWYAEPDDTPALAAAADAVWRERRIHVHYHRWREPTDVERTLDPYGLVLKAGRWYLVAASARISTYRVSQIRSLTGLDEGFQRPVASTLPRSGSPTSPTSTRAATRTRRPSGSRRRSGTGWSRRSSRRSTARWRRLPPRQIHTVG